MPEGFDTPAVSIIVPAFDAERFLERTLESVANQTFRDWECLIVVDRKSRDSTMKIARKWAEKDGRFRALPGPAAGGVAANRNEGIDQARGRRISFLDADDLWRPEKLERQIRFMDEVGARFSFCSYELMAPDGTRTGKVRRAPPLVRQHDLLSRNLIGCLTVVVDADLVDSLRFEEKGHEDLIYWWRVLGRCSGAHGLDAVLADYRLSPGSRSRNKMRAARWRWQFYRHDAGLAIAPSLGYFVKYAWQSLKELC